VGFDVLTACQPSAVWCSRERLPAAAAQPAQGSSEPVAPRIYLFIYLKPISDRVFSTAAQLKCFLFSNLRTTELSVPTLVVNKALRNV
jgi:hypothetical protein